MTSTSPEAGRLRDTLLTTFGFDNFRPGQEQVIQALMDGHSAAAVFPTGGGKSLCYQLPALLLPGLTLVVSPLIALMKDQIDHLQQRGIAAARLDSGLDRETVLQVNRDIRSGALKLLYVAPERFNNERFRETLGQQRISLMAVDEAHCISEWGHNFRPDYLKLAGFARMCRAERVLALTATAPPKVLEDIRAGFEIAAEHTVRTGFFRPNLTLLSTPVSAEQRDEALVERLREREPGATIVYVTLQRTAEEVAERLQRLGFNAMAYHAGMPSEVRSETQERFSGSDRAIVVATIAFGMGIDKADIRYVYHYNPPKSLENLAQEIGRAGRDGEPAICEQLICSDDLPTIRNFALGDTPTRSAIRSLLGFLFESGEHEPAVNMARTAADHDIRQLVTRTLLTYLELEGYLAAGTPFYASYRFKPLVSSAEMLNHFQGERREFLRSLLRQSKKARTWFDIDLEESSRVLGQERSRLVSALDYLAQQGWMELKPTDVRFPYRRLQSGVDCDALAETLYQRALEQESRELERFQQVLDLVGSSFCRWYRLCDYFGEDLGQACENCSFCFDGEGFELEEPGADQELDPALIEDLKELARHHSMLTDPRVAARLLVGIGSPHMTRAKLNRHRLFGALPQVPLERLIAECQFLEDTVEQR